MGEICILIIMLSWFYLFFNINIILTIIFIFYLFISLSVIFLSRHKWINNCKKYFGENKINKLEKFNIFLFALLIVPIVHFDNILDLIKKEA